MPRLGFEPKIPIFSFSPEALLVQFSPETRSLPFSFKRPKNPLSFRMSQTPTPFWLTDVKYLEEKRAIALEFSQLNNRRMSRLPFFPSFYASQRELAFEALKETISGEKKRFKLEQEGTAFKVSASTFSDLQSLANAVFNETGFRPIVLEPERQFLLERNWSFFDCFTPASEKTFEKSSSFSLPEAKLGLFSEPLYETLEQLLLTNPKIAQKTAESIVLSQLLLIKLSQVPENAFLQQEMLLESIFWKSGINLGKISPSGETGLEKPSQFKGRGFSEVDFSGLWPVLLTKPIYNLGFDSLNCDCCTPQNHLGKNVLPNSLVIVEMQKDGFFFESALPSFSQRFHESSPEKGSRLRRKEEFCLKTIPLGPFFRNQCVEIPLFDALKLQSQGDAVLAKPTKLFWFCQKQESLLSKQIVSLNKKISFLESELEEMGKEAMKQHKILGSSMLAASPDFLFQKTRLKALSRLLSSIPSQLSNPKSAFFSMPFGSAIESIEASVLESFQSFAASRKCRVFTTEKNKALLRSEKPYSLIKQFSEKEKVPALITASSR